MPCAAEIRDRLLTGLDQEYNVVDMAVVVEVISQLETLPITKEALETTRLGKHVNELRRKAQDRYLASRAKNLVKKWRQLLVTPTAANAASQADSGGSSSAVSSRVTSPAAVTQPATTTNHKQQQPLQPQQQPHQQQQPAMQNHNHLHHNQHPHSNNSRRLPQPGNTGSSLPSSNSTSPESSRPPSPFNDAAVSDRVSRTRASNKRLRKPDEQGSRGSTPPPQPPPSKRQKQIMVNGNTNAVSSSQEIKDDNSNCDKAVGKATNNGHGNSIDARNNRRKTRSSVTTSGPSDMLEQQMLSVIDAGVGKGGKKVKSTREIVEELAARSHSPGLVSRTTAAAAAATSAGSVESSAPETQSELMSRFFRSQQQHHNGGSGSLNSSAPPSPPPASTARSTSGTTTPRSLAAPHSEDPVSDAISEVMSRLPVISSSEVLSELNNEQRASYETGEEEEGDGEDGDDGLEVEGLIPVKPRLPQMEVTPELVGRLHSTPMENFNGNTDHRGEFREWNEVVSKETTEGELLYVLPYSVIE